MARVIKSSGGPKASSVKKTSNLASKLSTKTTSAAAFSPKREIKSTLGKSSVADKRSAEKSSSVSSVNAPASGATVLVLQRINPLSAAKVTFFVSIALGICFTLAVSIFWTLLDGSGIIFQFSSAMVSSGLGVDMTGVFSVGRIAMICAIIACINVVLLTALSVVFAGIYNMAARLAGGIKLQFTRE